MYKPQYNLISAFSSNLLLFIRGSATEGGRGIATPLSFAKKEKRKKRREEVGEEEE